MKIIKKLIVFAMLAAVALGVFYISGNGRLKSKIVSGIGEIIEDVFPDELIFPESEVVEKEVDAGGKNVTSITSGGAKKESAETLNYVDATVGETPKTAQEIYRDAWEKTTALSSYNISLSATGKASVLIVPVNASATGSFDVANGAHTGMLETVISGKKKEYEYSAPFTDNGTTTCHLHEQGEDFYYIIPIFISGFESGIICKLPDGAVNRLSYKNGVLKADLTTDELKSMYKNIFDFADVISDNMFGSNSLKAESAYITAKIENGLISEYTVYFKGTSGLKSFECNIKMTVTPKP